LLGESFKYFFGIYLRNHWLVKFHLKMNGYWWMVIGLVLSTIKLWESGFIGFKD